MSILVIDIAQSIDDVMTWKHFPYLLAPVAGNLPGYVICNSFYYDKFNQLMKRELYHSLPIITATKENLRHSVIRCWR